MFKHILCPIDGSQGSLEALNVAAQLASEQHAALTICNVVDPSQAAAMAFGDPGMSAACYNALEEEAKAVLADAAAGVVATAQAKTTALNGQTVEAIIDYCEANACDLIVMGSHGRTGFKRALLGSVAEAVLRHANVPVMVVRWAAHATRRQPSKTAQVVATA